MSTTGVPVSPSAGIRCRILDSKDEIHAMRTSWERLQNICGKHAPNIAPERFLTVAASLKGTAMCVIAAERDNELVGLLAGRVTRARMGFRVGYLPLPTPRVQRLDVVYQGFLAEDAHVQQSLLEAMQLVMHEHHWDVVQYNHVESKTEKLLRDAHKGSLRRGATQIHWVWDIHPGSYEETIARFSRKHRYNLRRYDKLLCEGVKDTLEIRWYTQPDSVDTFVKEASAITAHSYQQSLGAGVRDTPLWRSIVHGAAKEGRFCACVMYGNGSPIAYQFGTVYGSTFFLEAMTYDQHYKLLRPGAVLLQRVVHYLCEHGKIERIDYGFGDAQYKQTYGTSSWDERTVRLYGDSLRARVVSTLDGVSTWMTKIFRRWESKGGPMSRIKRRWRDLLRQRKGRVD
jgi:GNAT acetyltransferase-like protein